jgi:hypothetical protein
LVSLVLAIVVILAIVLLNVAVTVALLRSQDYGRDQKVIQALLVWLLPPIGALVVLHFVRESRTLHRGQLNGEGDDVDDDSTDWPDLFPAPSPPSKMRTKVAKDRYREDARG